MNESTGKKGDERNSGNNADSDKQNVGDTGQSKGISDGASGSQNDNGEGSGDGQKDNTGDTSDTSDTSKTSDEQLKSQYESKGTAESEKMMESMEKTAQTSGVQDMVQMEFNGQYVSLTLNGSVLFASGKAEIAADAKPLLDKVATMISSYTNNMIEVEGHTDSVPMHSSKYESNDVLSMYRALNVADYLRGKTAINPGNIISTGRGEYDPIASNDTADGRALNRRVTLKIYNTLSSQTFGQTQSTDTTN
jgi:chemotaxis protein MotB